MQSDFSETDAGTLLNDLINVGYTNEEAAASAEEYKLELLRNILEKGTYTVEYIAEDKAGNITTYHNTDEIISIQNGKDVPILNESKIGIDKSINSYNEEGNKWQVTTKGVTGTPSLTNDALNFLWLEMKGDFTFTIKVNSIQVTGTNSVGLMVRSSLEPNSVFTAIEIQDDGDVLATRRLIYGGEKFTGVTLPDKYSTNNTWMRVEREGNTVNKYISSDGINYILVEQVTFTDEVVYVGAFQTDYSGSYANAVFSIIPVNAAGIIPEGYGVFSLEQTILSDRSRVIGGKVGSNGYVELGFESKVFGNTVAGGNYRMKDRSKVAGDLTVAGTLTRGNQDTVTGAINRPSAIPALQLPTLATIQNSNNNIIIPYDFTYTLTPGEYGDIIVNDRAKLILNGAGTYYFRTLIINQNVEVRLPANDAVEIRAAYNLTIGDRSTIGNASTSPAQVLIYSNQMSQLTVGHETYISGKIIAPQAAVEIRTQKASNGTPRFRGYILGKRVLLNGDVYIDATGAF